MAERRQYHLADTIVVAPPVCRCGAWDAWKIISTDHRSDGAKVQYAECGVCMLKKKIIWKLPQYGNVPGGEL